MQPVLSFIHSDSLEDSLAVDCHGMLLFSSRYKQSRLSESFRRKEEAVASKGEAGGATIGGRGEGKLSFANCQDILRSATLHAQACDGISMPA